MRADGANGLIGDAGGIEDGVGEESGGESAEGNGCRICDGGSESELEAQIEDVAWGGGMRQDAGDSVWGGRQWEDGGSRQDGCYGVVGNGEFHRSQPE